MKRQFGRYQLLYRFASGGMAELYLARLTGADGFEKLVAIKVIHRHLNDQPAFVKRFINEARLASLIVHPHVAQIIELGRMGKTHFIAMEYVEGESLASILKRTRLSVRMAARIAADAAAGLHAAHELRGEDGELRHVVHRDVSPQNILVSYKGVTKVVDFGVAQARGSLHTTDGRRKGKLAYMAPEQLSDDHSIDRRTDTFALGIVLYEMATGRRLFDAESEAKQIAKVLHGEVPLPSSYEEDFPPAMEQIILQALSRDQATRFQTARDLQVALERFIVETGEPLLQAEVGEMMSELFAQRIEQKKKLLVSADSAEDPSVPLMESQYRTQGGVVTRLEAFIEGMRPEDGLEGTPSTLTPPRRRRRVLALSGGALLVAAAVIGFVSLAYVEKPSQGTPPQLATVDARARRSPDSRPPARMISITVKARPRHAVITLDGKPMTNPLELRQAAREGRAALTVAAPGYVRQELEVPLDRAGAWEIVLERVRAKSPHRPPAKIPQKTPDPPQKPAKKQGELGDDDILNHSPYD